MKAMTCFQNQMSTFTSMNIKRYINHSYVKCIYLTLCITILRGAKMTNILIVEDEKNLARFIELELTHENYQVDIENDGATGLDKALNKTYDLIILDLMLPNINGLEICRQIRQQQTTPIIIITAKSDTYDKVAGLDYGADDYIVKPFDIEELLARIRAILRRQPKKIRLILMALL